MKNTLSSLEPKILWKHFYSISQIPHPSGNTRLLRQLIIDFGKNLGLQTKTDKAGNVLILKPASKGYEFSKQVILQAHIDMVPQKNAGVKHNFKQDPLDVFVDGDWVKARDTTLGADNGIGLAAILAVLESKKIKHGPIKALFTNDEETGMHGAFGLKKEFVQGDVLMNLDSEDEGELFVGCAGGIDADFTFQYDAVAISKGDIAFKISIGGLLGGHSGVDIHLERANANKLLFRFLKIAVAHFEARLVSVNGGSLRNAIPREAEAIITIPEEVIDDIKELVDETKHMFNDEFEGIEKNIELEFNQIDGVEGILPEEVQDDLINAVKACPNGVNSHIPQMPSVVETSTNMAVIKTGKNKIVVKCLLRSAVESRRYELCSIHESIFLLAGAKVEFSGGYPGWQPKFTSPILKEMEKIYKEKWGKKPAKKVIHAGLECGIIGALNPDLDMISFGPTIRFPHSPDEKVNIPSVMKFWEFLVDVLKCDLLKEKR